MNMLDTKYCWIIHSEGLAAYDDIPSLTNHLQEVSALRWVTPQLNSFQTCPVSPERI